MTVVCKQCGQHLKLKPDSHLPMVTQVIYWLDECEEMCPKCKRQLTSVDSCDSVSREAQKEG